MEIMNKKIAIYPGSFDPITKGHVDIIERALHIFDEVIILIANHPTKQATYDLLKRKQMVEAVIHSMNNPHVKVDTTEGLTIHYAQKMKASALVRGLRTVPDFEYEHEFFSANQFIDSNIDMVFFMAKQSNEFISSSMIKKLHSSGINIESLVPKQIIHLLK
jgi:pantetheine-phosphate adenylyltransferase